MNSVDELSKKRQSVLDVGQRNQYEAVQTEIRRNNEALTTLRRENKELRAALQQTLRGQTNVSIEDHYAKEEDLLHNKMCVLKRSLNAVKGKNAELAKEIEKTREENNNVQNEGAASAVDENSAVAKKIRALENRLDKCLIKHNEVNAIRRTYETLLERLQLEQAGFDTQLSSTEGALRSAERELTELNDVGQQASKGRDQARAEVNRLRAKLADDRRSQAKDVEQRTDFITEKRNVLEKKHNNLLVKMAQQEERHARAMQSVMGGNAAGSRRRPQHPQAQDGDSATRAGSAASRHAALTTEEVEVLRHQKDAYLKLRDATMSANVAQVIEKVLERRENHEHLQQTAAALEGEVEAGQEARRQMQAAWEDMNQRAGGAMVSAKTTRTARDKKQLASSGASGSGGAADSGTDDDDGAVGGGSGTAAEPDYGLLATRARQRRAVLDEFASHLKEREAQLEESQQQQDALSQLVTDIEAGVQHLAEKVSILPGGGAAENSSFGANLTASSSSLPMSAATNTNLATLLRTHELGEAAMLSAIDSADLLRSCDTKLQGMLAELSPDEVDAVARAMSTARVAVPTTNVRLALLTNSTQHEGRVPTAGTSGGAGGGHAASGGGDDDEDNEETAAALTAPLDDFPDSEIHDRKELKMMSLATVEREETKRMRKRAAAAAAPHKEEGM